MNGHPVQLTMELEPASRFELIDVRDRVVRELGDRFLACRRALYCSYHTTAGFLEQSLAARLRHSPRDLRHLVEIFRRLFPEDAGYSHDQLELRRELSAAQRRTEPRNADSHLTYIGLGLRNCVLYANHEPSVYLIDLDGVNGESRRRRRTTVLGFHDEERVLQERFELPISRHPVESVNLAAEETGLQSHLESRLDAHQIEFGRIDLALAPEEHYAGLTVNEYETLLMQHDLAEVLRDPFHFAVEKGRHALADPGAIPAKAWNYAKYDFIHLLNQVIDALGLSESIVERLVARAAAVPASRMLRMKRSISLPVLTDGKGAGRVVRGTYQSPILFQWQGPPNGRRVLDITLTRFV